MMVPVGLSGIYFATIQTITGIAIVKLAHE